MNVMDYLLKKIDKEPVHMGLIDPNEQKPKESGELARILESVGSDAIMVGGSTGITKKNLNDTAKSVKDNTDIPVIHFPTNATAISPHVDAIYFMSMLNSRDLDKVIGQQVKGSLSVRKLGIQPLPMGYVIVEPGMTVGEVGNADLIPRNDPDIALSFGLAAQYLGMRLFYLEAGSGAPEPIPLEMVKTCKENLDIPVFVGGGIRDPDQAKKRAQAGADVIVTGTVIEEDSEVERKLKRMIRSIKQV